MEKKLVDVGVWEYPQTPEGLAEASKDAEEYANKPRQYKEPMYVVQDRGYYGPINEYKRLRDFKACQIVYTANPKEK